MLKLSDGEHKMYVTDRSRELTLLGSQYFCFYQFTNNQMIHEKTSAYSHVPWVKYGTHAVELNTNN